MITGGVELKGNEQQQISIVKLIKVLEDLLDLCDCLEYDGSNDVVSHQTAYIAAAEALEVARKSKRTGG